MYETTAEIETPNGLLVSRSTYETWNEYYGDNPCARVCSDESDFELTLEGKLITIKQLREIFGEAVADDYLQQLAEKEERI